MHGPNITQISVFDVKFAQLYNLGEIPAHYLNNTDHKFVINSLLPFSAQQTNGVIWTLNLAL